MKTGTAAIIATLVIATTLASGPTASAQDPEPQITPVCSADLNADSIVDGADLDRLLRAYGACAGCDEDLNRDKSVDDNDVAIMMRRWGPCRPEGDVFGGDHSKDSPIGDADSLTYPEDCPTILLPPQCKGDLNGDAFVDAQDMTRLLPYYGACAACEEDLNKDGLVDDADAQIIDRKWGPCRPEGDYFGGDHSADPFADAAHSMSDIDDAAPDDKKGPDEDVNDDGIVDMVDILIVVKYLGYKPTGEKAFSDVNNDGKIDKYDIAAIAKYVISG